MRLPLTQSNLFAALAAALLLTACAGQSVLPGAIQRPIVFDATRRQLSLDYLSERYGMKQQEPSIVPRMVVAHWTSIPTLEETFKAFNSSTLPGTRRDVQSAGALNVSAHYLVDRDGTIYQLLPETTLARHVIGLNHSAIGIENVGNGSDLPLTDQQLDANVRIVRYLHSKYDIEYLIGHHEYRAFEHHELWKEKDSGYRTEKTDPGADFMTRLRDALNDLELLGPPDQ